MTDHPTTRNGLSSPTRDAIAALSLFGDVTRDDAGRLLTSWHRAGELTSADRAAVLNHFPTAADLAALAALAHRVRAAGGGR